MGATRRANLLALWILAAIALPGFVLAQTAPKAHERIQINPPTYQPGKPVTLEADQMGYDETNHIVVARGHVTVAQGDQVLKSDQLVYFQDSGTVQAKGDVSVLQPTGDVYFADYVQLTTDM